MEKNRALQSSFEKLKAEAAELKLSRTIDEVCKAAVDGSCKTAKGPVSAAAKIKWPDSMSSFRIMTPKPEASPLKNNAPTIDESGDLSECDVKMIDLIAKMTTMTASDNLQSFVYGQMHSPLSISIAS